MKIGFIGLGQMGKPIAMNLLKSNAEITVFDVIKDNFSEFEKKGAKTTQEKSEIAKSKIIFLCVPNDDIVQDIIMGVDGISKSIGKGQIVVDLSTITYSITINVAKCLIEKGVDFLDCPISGMESRAIDGTLTVMCGGDEKPFKKVKPYLEFISNKILYMGPSGTGQFTKLINQLLFNINMAALAEILPMSIKMGLDPEKVGEVVNSGTGRSYASEFFIPRILKKNFSEGYALENAYKDLISGAEISANLRIPLPVLHAATTTYQMALLKGYGNHDKGAMIKVFEELLDVSYSMKK